MSFHTTGFEPTGAANPAILAGPHNVRRSYGRAAAAAAIENGLLPQELAEVLAGRSVVEAFPVAWRESVSDYADRAVAEMMVAYLSQPVA
ncbi:hypothetical protein [Methylobacterium sp. Leaf89]|uniref:hypothetical protein n=1 Tax=Methylobacterium sp. Leaf89 TaxID=1736245 RepID=UPI0006F9F295|nr:hypothetical protein [Methylobacterium sp. Leaf89]KQO67468.1 hypothetical protein ASF18_12610 [Methylobacterium sp. Leaf89]